MLSLPLRLLVFDLDGTLIDSQIDLINSINATLQHFNKPMLEGVVIAGYIGDGAATLVRRSLAHSHTLAGEPDPHDEDQVQQALTWFLAFYRIHKLDFTTIYPGVLEALTSIRSRHPDLPMAVLTNKPVKPSRDLCIQLGLAPFFFQNYGGDSFATKKPNPEGLLKLIEEASALAPGMRAIAPADTVLIGDSHFDIETAKNAGARSLGCTYGLAPESLVAASPNLLVNHASEWPQALGL